MLALFMATWNILSLFDYFNTILGLLTGGLGGLFVMGIFFPRIHARAAIGGLIMSFLLLFVITLFSAVSFLLYGFIGIVSSVGFAYFFCLIIPGRRKALDNLTIHHLKNTPT